MLSDEERKAIDYLQLCYDLSTITNESLSKLGIVLNLIEKQSKEIEEYKECERLAKRQLEKQKNDIKTLEIKIEELKEDSCCMTNCVRRDKEKLFLEDKIKAIIEERNKWLQEYDEQEEMNELQKDDYRLIKVERNILQSLLEKE